MIFSCLALLALVKSSRAFAHQVNPPGTQVAPSQTAFYSATGATATVEVRNSYGQVIPFMDTAGNSYDHVTVSFPSGTAVGLGWEITQTKPDGTDFLVALGSTQSSAVVQLLGGQATESPVGTYDSSAGAGNGIASGFLPPDSGTPTVFSPAVSYTISPGSIISSHPVGMSILSQSAGLAQDSSLPVNVNPLSLALADIGGSGVTAGIEYVDATGATIPLVDTSGVKWPAVTVTLSPSAKAGLSYLVLATSPDSTHPIAALPVGAVAVRIRCLSGTVGVPTLAINTGGLTSGAAGTGGSGYNTGFAPSASTPIQFYVGDTDSYGRIR